MIYLDMDGVLADFYRHTREENIPYNYQWYDPRETWTEETLEGERIKTARMHGPGFWNKIPPMPDAWQLWDFCVPYQPFILTAKPQPDSPEIVAEDKYKWIVDQLDSRFPKSRFICCSKADKPKAIGRTGHRFQILVDDDQRTCDLWEASKGVDHLQTPRAVHFMSAVQAIREIQEILNG